MGEGETVSSHSCEYVCRVFASQGLFAGFTALLAIIVAKYTTDAELVQVRVLSLVGVRALNE